MTDAQDFFSFHVRRGRIAKIVLPPSATETVVTLDPQEIRRNEILITAPQKTVITCEGKIREGVTAEQRTTTLAVAAAAATKGALAAAPAGGGEE